MAARAARITAPRSCCSASTSATTPPRRRPSVTDGRRHWITRYLNARFLRLPTRGRGARPRATLAPRNPDSCSTVHGEQHHLQRRALAAGTVRAQRRDRALVGARRRSSLPGAAKPRCGPRPVTSPPCTAMSSTTCCRRPEAATAAFRTSASASATSVSCCTSSPRSTPVASSRNTARTLLLLDHEPLPGPAGARSSPPRCPRRSSNSKNAPPAPTASRARKRSAAASARSCRSTASAATGPRRHATINRRSRRPTDVRRIGVEYGRYRTASAAPGTRRRATAAEARKTRLGGQPLRDRRARPSPRRSNLPDVAWITARDGSRARGGPRGPGRPLPPRPPRVDDQRRLPSDHRPDNPLARIATRAYPEPGP